MSAICPAMEAHSDSRATKEDAKATASTGHISDDAPSGVTLIQHNIFNIAYDQKKRREDSACEHPSSLQLALVAAQLCGDIFALAPLLFLSYYLFALWESLEPTIDLVFSFALFTLIEHIVQRGQVSNKTLLGLIMQNSAAICELIFGPASVGLDLQSSQEFETSALLPREGLFDWEVPGAEFLLMTSQKLRIQATIASQVLVIAFWISQKPSPEREILATLGVIHPLILFAFPTDESNTAAHIVWTESKAFIRMKALYTLAFGNRFRQDLTIDGATDNVSQEFEHASLAAGPVPDIKRKIMRGIPRAWYWQFIDSIMLHFSLITYSLALPWCLSISSVATIALLQQTIAPLRSPFSSYAFRNQPSFAAICQRAKNFYDALNLKSNMASGTASFPAKWSSEAGMKVSYRGVSYRYSGMAPNAVNDLSFDIASGQTVMIVGANGSGKSTLVKLLTRLFDPTYGDIFIDDLPLRSWDVGQVRASMAVLSQNSEIYPLSIRDNFTVGLPARKPVSQDDIVNAARAGGAYDLIQRLPDKFNTVLDPASPFVDTVNGWVGGASQNLVALRQRKMARNVPISQGEKQRILASRMFTRLGQINARLVIVDEPTSSMDSISESQIFSRLLECRDGKTMVFITHRFGSLAKRVDLILCMDEGRIVEMGTHATLMHKSDGYYAKMYNVQAEGYGDAT
ncbi:hypothetical protein HWV62_6345 [Athelia sp. TMB]|nr:hypothetical protein HWV62_6345 [Athelia sp. TMB]